ncbi:myelin-associated glycoprotein isoform X2 [Oreochromis niloticus]|uniref:myelin-associated glycoprotein isoform X2 n=1 Tax=Oreochromis niloticus TaxID=8128 RepID=UPI000DF11D2B|nr:myelin-associated glycoprotein isoform X2 [Oreochromis niloticus]
MYKMSGFGHVILCYYILGYILCSSSAWQVTMPRNIKGLLGSCLVIPCSYDYDQYPPKRPDRVVWYQYVSRGYPLVYDNWNRNDVLDIFKGRTSVYSSSQHRKCSLLIDPVTLADHSQKLYPWVDPENVGSGTYPFYDTTVTVEVVGSISGLTVSSASYEFLEGEPNKVTCTVSYTCYRNIPTLTWNYGNMPASSDTSKLSGGAQWRTVSTLTFTASANDNGRSLICYARFPGGQTREASITLRVKRNILNLGWSFTAPATITGLKGSCLTIPCKFSYKNSQPNDLQVMWYLYQKNEYPAVFNQGGTVNRKFNGRTSLTGSVTEKNCSLKIERLDMSHNRDRLYPWIDKNPIASYGTTDHTFYDGSTELVVSEHAPEPQLSIIGILRVGEQGTVSCSVRHTCLSAPPTLSLKDLPGIDQNMDTLVSEGIWERKIVRTWTVEEEHKSVSCAVNYPAGQSAEKSILLTAECSISPLNISSTSDQTQEVNISMRVKTSPEKPVMTPVPEEVNAGSTITVSCSVTHTCSSHPPVFSWSVSHLTSEVSHIMMSRGTWQTTSTITFIVTEGDGVRNLTCNAIFWRNRQQAHTVSLNVKGSLMYQFTSAAPVAFPVSFVALIIITLAAVFAVFIWRKRKHTDESLKPPPRPEQRRSLWDRLSRRQDRTANISVAYTKNSSNVTCGAESKPRCPSPKDNRRRPSPFNPEVSGIAVNDKIQINQI